MTIKNQPSINEEHVNDLRGAFEHRATWFYLLLDEARKAGLGWDEFARKAIFRCGCFHGDNKFTKTDDIKAFTDEFANEKVKKIFEMDVQATDEEMVVEFHYCPLVAAWQKLTDNEEEIDHLCDIAMDGDRGIISTFDKFEFDLQETIAAGGDVCRVIVRKK